MRCGSDETDPGRFIRLRLQNVPLSINWNLIINYQIANLRREINKVGIPDLIILDQVISNNLILYSEDRHFRLMRKHVDFASVGEDG